MKIEYYTLLEIIEKDTENHKLSEIRVMKGRWHSSIFEYGDYYFIAGTYVEKSMFIRLLEKYNITIIEEKIV